MFCGTRKEHRISKYLSSVLFPVLSDASFSSISDPRIIVNFFFEATTFLGSTTFTSITRRYDIFRSPALVVMSVHLRVPRSRTLQHLIGPKSSAQHSHRIVYELKCAYTQTREEVNLSFLLARPHRRVAHQSRHTRPQPALCSAPGWHRTHPVDRRESSQVRKNCCPPQQPTESAARFHQGGCAKQRIRDIPDMDAHHRYFPQPFIACAAN